MIRVAKASLTAEAQRTQSRRGEKSLRCLGDLRASAVKKPLLKNLFLLAAMIFSISARWQSLLLTGTVTDQNNAVVAGATIKAIHLASGRTFTATTDSQGAYRIEGLPSGSYRLSATSDGFAVAARTATIEGERTTQNFLLVPGAIQDRVTVTAAKGAARAWVDTPQTVTITDETEIERRRFASTLEAIEKTPNLTPIGSNPAGERPRLRGLASNRVLIIIDGDRLNNVRSDPLSGVSPAIIDVSELQSAEVISGAGSSLYGSDAMAGVINLITRAPVGETDRAHLSVRFDGDLRTNGPFIRGATSILWSRPRVAARVSGSLFEADSYRAGNQAIEIDEVARFGRFASEMGNAVGNNVALTYSVWSLPARAEIANGKGRGFNDQIDLRFSLSPFHSLRYRQSNSQHKDIGFPFITPPFDGRRQFNGFRRLDKYASRYEGHQLSKRVPRLAAGFYRQKYAFADDNFVSTINEGSSWELIPDPQTGSRAEITGRPSTFTEGSFTDGKNAVTSRAFDIQASFIPASRLIVTSGAGYLRDSSRDFFSRIDFASPPRVVRGKASNPDSVYRNIGWFNLAEYEPVEWLRLTAGLRVDDWRSEAKITRGFPLGTESAILDASLDLLQASPGQINVEGLRGIADLVSGKSGIVTSNTTATGNVGVVARTKAGVNAYFRWGNSYREPGITERYILRNFGDPTFSVLLSANTHLRPERGRSLDSGVKVRRDRWNASLGYFRNDFEDFLRIVFSDVLFVPADPRRGLEPISPDFPFHGVLYAQRANIARARIQGVEAVGEVDIASRAGTITPFASAGWLRGEDLSPDPGAVALIKRFYNRRDTPVKLEGAAEDVPLASITPFRGVCGARYTSAGGKWFGAYQARFLARVRRVDPFDLSTSILTQYGLFAGLNSFTTHSIRGGYSYRGERARMVFSIGVENAGDRLYFDHFQNAPAAGRSLIFGVTVETKNLLR
jgi:outer membrane receptor protein involved in Fe transport